MGLAHDKTRFVSMSALLGLAVVIVVGLGLSGIMIAGFFRRTAEGVLRDYTTLAADRLTQNIEIGLARGLYPLINTERTALISNAWVPSETVLTTSRAAPVAAAPTVTSVFIRRPHETPQIWPANTHVTDLFSGTLEAWEVQLGSSGYFALEFAPDENRLALFNIERTADDEIALAYGVILPTDSVLSVVATVMRQAPTLPEHVTDSIPNDSLQSVVITTNDGTVLVRHTLPATLPYTVTRPLSSPSGLNVQVALSANLATRLVHGVPPAGIIWLFAGLAGLAVALLGSAALVWRQDRRLVQLREQFVAGVSHELRTPLAQIRLFAETLALGRVRDDREVQQAHRVVEQETRRLTHLVENLLLFSRQERGQLELSRQTVDASRLIAEIVAEFKPLAQAGEADLRTDIEPDLHADIDADAIRQIALNLLDNAVKYGRPKQTVTLQLVGSPNQLILSVEDEGSGVPREHRERIWERFWRGPDVSRSGKGGSGIGLAVVKELATRHGGRATVEPGNGAGARFVVTIPRQF